MQGPTVSLGLYVNAGSANETERNTGASTDVQTLLFQEVVWRCNSGVAAALLSTLTRSYQCTGTCHLLESMAFKATQHRTHFRLVREVSWP